MHLPKTAVFLLAIALLTCACSQADSHFIDQNEMEILLNSHQDVIILDVREPHERHGPLGRIRASVNIPLAGLGRGIARLDPGLDAHIIVLCRTQNRSQAAYNALKEMGYVNVYVLKGGMSAYDHGR